MHYFDVTCTPQCTPKRKPPEGGLVSPCFYGGAEEDRTPDLVIANDALSQLSYGPVTEYTVVASTDASSRYSNTMARE